MFATIIACTVLTFVMLCVLYLLLPFIANWLAGEEIHTKEGNVTHAKIVREWFFTQVPEARARVRRTQGKFTAILMTHKGHRLRGNYELTDRELREPYKRKKLEAVIEEEVVKDAPPKKVVSYKETDEKITDVATKKEILDPDPWDIVPCESGEDEYWLEKLPLIGRFMGGLRCKGIPKLNEIYEYRQRWVEWGYGKDAQGNATSQKGPLAREENLRHVILAEDVYFVAVDKAETSEAVPVDISLLLTIAIVNPKKALFGAQKWVEAVTNQAVGSVREFIGTNSYDDLFKNQKATASWLVVLLQERLERFRKEYGVAVRVIEIQSLDPDKDYRALTTQVYEAEKKAQATRIAADAEEYRLKKTLGKTAELVGPNNAKWDLIRQTKITTYVEGNTAPTTTSADPMKAALTGAIVGSLAEKGGADKKTDDALPSPEVGDEKPTDPKES